MAINCSSIGDFKVCENNSIIIIGDNKTSGSGFSIANYPKNFTLPSLFENKKITEIGLGAFCCTSVKSVIVGKYVIKIHQSAFRHCVELDSIILPPTVRYIGEGGIRRAYGNGVVNEASLYVYIEPDSQLQYLDSASISGSIKITIIFCGCIAPKHINIDAFMQAKDLKIITPVSMLFNNKRTIAQPQKCYTYPVYKRYNCRCLISYRINKDRMNLILTLMQFISI